MKLDMSYLCMVSLEMTTTLGISSLFLQVSLLEAVAGAGKGAGAGEVAVAGDGVFTSAGAGGQVLKVRRRDKEVRGDTIERVPVVQRQDSHLV